MRPLESKGKPRSYFKLKCTRRSDPLSFFQASFVPSPFPFYSSSLTNIQSMPRTSINRHPAAATVMNLPVELLLHTVQHIHRDPSLSGPRKLLMCLAFSLVSRRWH